jgi:FlaA1/EpsC-like NDP-sugar epimerase
VRSDDEAIASTTVRDGEEEKGETVPAVRSASTVVVTGAAGWLGQNLVRALAAQPNRSRIRCLVHEPGDASPL